jgi:arylsulfatase A-like enzyme
MHPPLTDSPKSEEIIVKYVQSLIRALLLGATAGCVSFFLDLLLARVTLDYRIHPTAGYALWYAGAGVVFAAVLHTIRRKARSIEVFAGTLALLYMPPLFERVYGALDFRFPASVAIVVGLVILMIYGLWISILKRVIKREHRSWAPVLGASTAAVGLALNRNIVDYPLEFEALVLDFLVLGLALAVALALRHFGTAGAILVGGAACLILTATVTFFDQKIVPAPDPAGGSSGHNLVMIIIDTIRQDVFSSVVAETEEGSRFQASLEDAGWFSNAVAASPWTAPSVGSIMTGLYPGEHGFGSRTEDPSRPLQRLGDSVPTLAEHLSSRGYQTMGIVTNTLLHPASGVDRGFSHYSVLKAGTAKLPLITVAVRLGVLQSVQYQPAASIRKLLEHRVDRLADSDRPFFLWLHLMDPHAPLFEHPNLPPENGLGALPATNRLYRDEVRYVLSETARMIELFKSRVDWDNTITVIVGDHGEMFPSDRHDAGVKTSAGAPMLRGHGHALYEELVEVPMVIRPAGGLVGGRDVEALASHIDLMATISDLLDREPFPAAVDRFSLAPHLASQAPSDDSASRHMAYIGATQIGPVQFAIRSDDFKLIYYPNGDRVTEVFSLVDDPSEQVNLGPEGHPLAKSAIAMILEHALTMSSAEGSGPIEFDRDTREQLKALGYLDSE